MISGSKLLHMYIITSDDDSDMSNDLFRETQQQHRKTGSCEEWRNENSRKRG